MGGDGLFKRRQEERRLRHSKKLELRSETWLIVCEGKETEVNYFKSFLNYANSISDRKIKFEVIGLGRNTTSLVNSVDGLFNYSDSLLRKTRIPYGKVFVVFDKDDFTDSQFNLAIQKCHSKGYVPLWSNECIELWFILHYEYIQSSLTRKKYFEKLSQKLGKKYTKNDNHFELLNSKINIQNAYKNAKKLYECNNMGSKTYAEQNPSTTIYKIIDEIEESLDIKLK